MLNLSLNGGGWGEKQNYLPPSCFPHVPPGQAPLPHPCYPNLPIAQTQSPQTAGGALGWGASPENRKEKEDVDEFEGESLRLWVSYSKIFFS